MTKKFLLGMLAIALAFGVVVTGCNEADEEGFKDRTVNLTPVSGENAIILTVKGATWKNPEGNVIVQGGVLDLLEWTSVSGSIENLLLHIKMDYSLINDNKLKVSFSKQSVAGIGITGTGTVQLKDVGLQLYVNLLVVADIDSKIPDWSIGKNDPVTITIN